jgi:hypothetical protein
MHPVGAIFAGYFAPGAVAGFALVKFLEPWAEGLGVGPGPSAGLNFSNGGTGETPNQTKRNARFVPVTGQRD